MKIVELKAPMSFQGGKQKVAKRLVNIIKGDIENTQYIDLCCGSGAVSVELINQGVHPENITMVDASDWGDFWGQVSTGNFDMCWFEDNINGVPEDPDMIKRHLESYAKGGFEEGDDVIPVWLILQAGSFGGKHIYTESGVFKNASFRNYWRPTETSNRRSPVNPMMPMPKTLLRQVSDVVSCMSPIKAHKGFVEDFNWDHYEGSRTMKNVVVFIDPPYNNTTKYGFDLDYIEFMKILKTLPCNYSVFITDYVAHSDVYWELLKTNKGGISGSSSKSRTEILSKLK